MKSSSQSSQLPLAGVKVVEFEGIGPGPLAGFHLVQLGASVTLVAQQAAGGLVADRGDAGLYSCCGLCAAGQPDAARDRDNMACRSVLPLP